MKLILKTAFVFFLLLSSHTTFGAGNTYYAAPGGGAAASCVDSTTNVCTLSRAITVAGNGDTIILTEGTYVGTELGASGYVLMTSELINLTCAGTRTCIFRPSATTAGVRFVTPPTNGSTTISGIVIDGVYGTSPNYCFWPADNSSGIYTITVNNSTCNNPAFYGVYSAATQININLNDLQMTANNAVHGRSFLYTERTSTQWATGTIKINGGSAQIDSHNVGGTGVINIDGFGDNLAASVDGWSGVITLDPTLTSTGEHACVQLLNVASSSIQNSSCSVGGNVGSRSTALFRINSCGNLAGQGCSGTETPRNIPTAIIRNVTGIIGTPAGYGAIIGQDATSDADNKVSNARIEKANITCRVANTSAHGVMLGYLVGGSAVSSFVDSCGINFISKKNSTTASTFSGNISINAINQHFRAKGGLALWVNNTAYSSTGSGNLFYADQETISGQNSTVSLYNNLGMINGGIPTYKVFIDPASTLSFASNNNWFALTGTSTWRYLNTIYGGLSSWNATTTVGTDYEYVPVLRGGYTPIGANSFRLNPESPLIGAGIRVGDFVDNLGRWFNYKPSIGAWEVGSRDFANYMQF